MKILVTGANGYVGTHLLLYLTRQGHKVFAVVKPAAKDEDLAIIRDLNIEVVRNDLTGNGRLEVASGNVDAVIHLLGSVQAPEAGTFRSVHEGKTRFLSAECRRLGVKKFVYLGTLGASLKAPSEYLRTKWLAEEEVRRSGVDYVIVRSPLIFGKSFGVRESKVVAKLKELIRTAERAVPILGSGKNLLQPIFVGDVVRCLEKAAADPAVRDETIDLGGPEQLSFEEMIDILMVRIGVKKKKVKIPFPIAFALAYVLERIKANPRITTDQVRMLREDVVCNLDRMNRLFGPPTVSFRDGA